MNCTCKRNRWLSVLYAWARLCLCLVQSVVYLQRTDLQPGADLARRLRSRLRVYRRCGWCLPLHGQVGACADVQPGVCQHTGVVRRYKTFYPYVMGENSLIYYRGTFFCHVHSGWKFTHDFYTVNLSRCIQFTHDFYTVNLSRCIRGWKFTHDWNIVKRSRSWLCGHFLTLLFHLQAWFLVNTWGKEILIK